MIQAFQPGQVVEARGRLWRVERSDDQVLYVVPLEQVEASPVALFLPLEGAGIRPMAAGRPPVEPGDPVLHDLFLRAHRFTMMHGAAPLVSLQRSRVIPTNYQLVPVMMALEMPRVRLMIADDVGLGKTIEAGLIAVELLARKRAQRVLVVTPANLRVQWQQAFKYFFHLAFTVLSSVTQRKLGQSLPPGANPWAYFPFVITSLDYAKTDAVRNLVLGQRWDLVIVDEAHSAAMPVAGMGRGSSDKESFEFVRDLTRKATHAVLATATPHNGYSVSFASLLRMLDEVEDKPGQIRSAFGIVDGTENEPRVNRAKAVRHVVQRRRQDVLEWFEREGKPAPFPMREGTSEQFIEPNKTELAVYEALQNYQRFVFQPRDGHDAPVVTKWMVMHFLRLATSSPRALRASMEARIRTLKGRMTQDDDPVLSAATQRSLRDTVLDHGDAEIFTEDELDDHIPTLSVLDRANIGAEIGYLGVVLEAIRAWRPAQDSKLKHLKDLLTSPMQLGKSPRTIVFTRYKNTMTYLADEIGKALPDCEVFQVSGDLTDEARAEQLERFGQSKRGVLVATDAISEGLNLQFAANQLVHYELPWNPNRLEQRNGRIDRFRQPEPVVRIRTLIMQRSFDLVVFDRLILKANRIREAYGFVPGYFSDPNFLDAVLSEELLTARREQANLFDVQKAPTEDVNATETAQLQRMGEESFYGQVAFRLPDVESRLAQTQRTVGSPLEVERLVVEALRFLGWQVTDLEARLLRAQRAGGENVPTLPDQFDFTLDADLGARLPHVQTLDVAAPEVAELLTVIRRRAYRDLDGARTAVIARKFPAGLEPVAHAVFHVRARFTVGTRDLSVIEALVAVTLELSSQQPCPDVFDALWAAPSGNMNLPEDALINLTRRALETPNLDRLIQDRIEDEARQLGAERAALKVSLLGAYPAEAEWLEGLDHVVPAAHDVLGLTVILPGG